MAASVMILELCSFLILLSNAKKGKMEIILADPDVLIGEDALLLCKAGGEGEIKWLKNEEDVDEDQYVVEKIDETTSKLTIKKAKPEDSGKYTCECEFETGQTDSRSVDIFVYDKVAFGSTTTYHEFLQGQTVVVPCIVTGKPEVEVNWIWKNRVIDDGHKHFKILPDKSLEIQNIQREDDGNYICEGKIKGAKGPDKAAQLSISVVVNAPPTVKIREELKKVVAGPETNVTLQCLVTGAPQPTISWTYPANSDFSRYIFNSDKSQLVIPSVVRSDFGEYICTATNKIAENSATFTLDVSEHPVVVLSQEVLQVEPGQTVSVSCNATGHPAPTLRWVRKNSNEDLSSSIGRRRVVENELIIENVAPSDGGLYSCVAVNNLATTSRDFALQTKPDKPVHITAAPGPTSVHFTLNNDVLNGGSPITYYVAQWRKNSAQDWKQINISHTEQLVITSLEPYTAYLVRLAAQNAVGLGNFSSELPVRTQGMQGEPDSPVLTASKSQVKDNSFSIPLKQLDNGGSPITSYAVHYKVDKDKEDWRTKSFPGNSTSIYLDNLQYNAEYQMEVFAVNLNGSSIPVSFNFSIPQPAASSGPTLGKGGVVGIVLFIFFVLLVAVDAACCYTNRCGLLRFIALKLCGQKVPGEKSLEEGDGNIATVDLKFKGLDVPRASIPKLQTQNGASGGAQSEVTCDKAPLTKFEKPPANTDPAADAGV
ncbi:neural cell adhesion molecule 1 [Chanos chanos]|uniref:Neural cell adhesion molecule 1 n=1 Tax=Chanos chanos TaxID=29144 RepID=A0A6J2W463_CHACN|nr:neural cell adhesion molecule 1-like [Chanos chanos]